MRCKYCGSNVVHPDTQHKVFSGKKAVAGAVMFGAVGAAAGMIGKDTKGYKCGSCGAFMESPMEYFTESSIDRAIRDAESGGDCSMYNYFKGQYPNIQANIPVAAAAAPAPVSYEVHAAALPQEIRVQAPQLKHCYNHAIWRPDCPIFVEKVLVKKSENGDVLSLIAWNQSKSAIRSAYFKVTSYDDTGDKITEVSCVYQGLNVAPGGQLPAATEFKLNTDVAYRVEIQCEKVAMADDSVWRNEENLSRITLIPQGPLTKENFPRYKYLRKELAKTTCTVGANADLFMPVKTETHWQCICGHPSLPGEPCRFCRILGKDLEECTSQNHLKAVQQAAVKKIAETRAKAAQELWDQSLATAYDSAAELLKGDTISSVEKAISAFKKLGDYKDAAAQVEKATVRLQELKDEKAKREEEARIAAEKKAEAERIAAEKAAEEKRIAREKLKKKLITFAAIAAAVFVVFVVVFGVLIPNSNYNKAKDLLANRDFAGAIEILQELEDYKDAPQLLAQAKNGEKMVNAYNNGVAEMNEGDYDAAIAEFYTIVSLKEVKIPADGGAAAAPETVRPSDIKGTERLAEEAAEKLAKMATYEEFPDLVARTQECFVRAAQQELDVSDADLDEYYEQHEKAYYLLQAAGENAEAKEMLSHFVLRNIYVDSSNVINKYVWYNEAGNVVIDENGYQYSYDALGRVEKKVRYSKNSLTKPGTVKATVTYTYDEAGRVATMTEGTLVYTYTYDEAGRVATITGGTLPCAYTYDEAGRIATMTEGTLVYTYTYDEAGLLTGRNGVTATGKAITETYTYTNGLLTEVVTDNESTNRKIVQTNTYDAEGRLTAKTYKETRLKSTYTYANYQWKYVYGYIYCPNAEK